MLTMSTSTTEHDAYLVENWDTETLILYLQERGLQLNDNDFAILRKREIFGQDFLDMTRYDFTQAGLELGPAMRLAKEANALKATTPKRSFSSYHNLSEVLEKYGIESEGIDAIPLFNPPAYKIQDNDKHFEECITEISIRLRDYGDLNPDSLEAVRNEYVVAILHAALHIVRDDTKKKFSMRPQQEIIDEESCGRVDYAIKVGTSVSSIIENN